MGNDPRKRQKKLERRASKRKDKKHVRIRDQSAGLAERLSAASAWPILHCWIGEGIGEQGIGWVVLSRVMPNGPAAVVSFLVDSYCLGVKDVFAEILPRSTYDSKYLRKMAAEMPSRSAAPAEARKLLEEAVAYAREIGLSPHPDYLRAMILFGDIDAADSDVHFQFWQGRQALLPQRPQRFARTMQTDCGDPQQNMRCRPVRLSWDDAPFVRGR